ncbi:MAG: BamA/TamA family outer membrane protein [Gemmatimonadota bacterium]
MATERALLLLALACVATPCALAAQNTEPPPGPERSGPPLFLIDTETGVAELQFDIAGDAVEPARLADQIALTGPGFVDEARRFLSWIPFISEPPLTSFSPIELQKDKIRLVRFLERDGFPQAAVDYRVRLDTARNAVTVVFEVEPGPPQVLDSVSVSGADEGPLLLPPELESEWRGFRRDLTRERGERLSQARVSTLASRVLEWWRDHGFAFTRVRSRVEPSRVDAGASTELPAIVELMVTPGPQTTIGSIVIEGDSALSERTILRELPFQTGDRFRSSQLAEGQSQLFGLEIVRLALVGVPDDQPVDSTAEVRVRIEEGSPRIIEGRLGYTSDEGITTQASWSHRDFLGAARVLTLSAEARTGWWSGQQGPSARYSITPTLRQPWLGHYRVSGLVTPFFEYRDDLRDRSTRVGVSSTVLWERGALRTMSLSYNLSGRRVLQARGGALTGVTDFLGYLEALDTLDVDVRTSALQYAASWGEIDDPLAPRSGWVARIGAEITGPAALSNVQYGRLNGRLQGFLPIARRGALLLRGSLGQLLPYGESVPSGGDEVQTFLRLRDGVFTAGGTQDVRGWGPELLGPKVPDIRVTTRGDSVILGSASRYVPLGGLNRWTGSVELQLPMPFVSGPYSVHAFLDAGRVWTADDRFTDPAAPSLLDLDDGVFYGTGAGVQIGTPVGPLRLSVGYKLNPGVLDLRDPADVAEALITGSPLADVPEDQGRRWQIHLSIGRPF